MFKKVISFGMIFLMLGFLSIELVARNGAPYRTMKYGIRLAEKNLFPVEMLLRHKDDIGLMDSQVEKIEKMRLVHYEATIKRSSDIKVLELKLGSLFKKETVNRSVAQKMVRKIGEMKTDQFIKRINFMLDVKDVLNAEQIKKIETMKKEMRLRRFSKRDRMHPSRGEN